MPEIAQQFHADCRLLMALAVLLLSAPTVAAQDTVRLASLQVSLWPEYDQPATLVILDGQLDPTVPLPASLAVRVPARAGEPHAVATLGADGDFFTAAYTTQPAGDDIIVMFQTVSPGFRVEYYDAALAVDGEARQYAFDWLTDYAIAAAEVRVQQPAGARDVAGVPPLSSLGTGADGLTYYQASWGAAQPGDRLSLRLSYAKTGSALTVDALGGLPVPQVITPVPAGGTDNLPWIAGGVALGLAAGAAGVYAYTRSRRPAPARSARRRPATATAPARFCAQCGHARLEGDRFCRHCGTRLAVS